jgi:2-polyprenyl-3-methyl-5-hydroxy-6-metoxy-1,4-benzoquinol methylase
MKNKSILGRCFDKQKPYFALNRVQREARAVVLERINDGRYNYVNNPCPLAGSEGEDWVLATADRYGLPHRTVLNSESGLLRADPVMSGEAYADFYAHFYRKLYEGRETLTEGIFEEQAEIRSAIGPWLEANKVYPAGKTILEIGCGGGWALVQFGKYPGTVLAGYDFAEDYLEYGRKKKGLDLRHGGIDQALADGVKADIILLCHVVEHFTDPVAELAKIKKLLKEDGLLFLETPGVLSIHSVYSSDFRYYLQNAHTFGFCRDTLKAVLMKAGFSIKAGDEYIRMLAGIDKPSENAFVGDPNQKMANAGEILEYIRKCEMRKRLTPGYYVRPVKNTLMRTLDVLGLKNLAGRIYRSVKKKGSGGND